MLQILPQVIASLLHGAYIIRIEWSRDALCRLCKQARRRSIHGKNKRHTDAQWTTLTNCSNSVVRLFKFTGIQTGISERSGWPACAKRRVHMTIVSLSSQKSRPWLLSLCMLLARQPCTPAAGMQASSPTRSLSAAPPQRAGWRWAGCPPLPRASHSPCPGESPAGACHPRACLPHPHPTP